MFGLGISQARHELRRISLGALIQGFSQLRKGPGVEAVTDRLEFWRYGPELIVFATVWGS